MTPMAGGYLLQAAQLLDEAVQRDPNFLLAYLFARRSAYRPVLGRFRSHSSPAGVARAALEKAERIQPDAGDVHMVKGLFAYHGHRDYDGARAEFALARRTLPNSSHLAAYTAAVDRRQGHWDDAFKNSQRAIELDPLDSVTLEEAGFTYSRLRRFAEAKPYWSARPRRTRMISSFD